MIFVGDVGTNIDIKLTGETITGATSYQMRLRDPVMETITTVTAAVEGTDTIRYVTQAGDLPNPGTWKAQGVINGLAGWSGSTTIVDFACNPILE